MKKLKRKEIIVNWWCGGQEANTSKRQAGAQCQTGMSTTRTTIIPIITSSVTSPPDNPRMIQQRKTATRGSILAARFPRPTAPHIIITKTIVQGKTSFHFPFSHSLFRFHRVTSLSPTPPEKKIPIIRTHARTHLF